MFLYGASGHAKVIIDILLKGSIPCIGFFDDNPEIKEVYDHKCYGKFNPDIVSGNKLIVSIGNNRIRKNIVNNIKERVCFGKAIDSASVISKSVKIGDGTVIMANTVINADAEIGEHVIINTSSSIDHECIIKDYVHISPNATLCGNVFVGEGTQIGAAAVVIPGIKIGKWCTIGAGAVIISDIPDHAKVVGNPGKIILLK